MKEVDDQSKESWKCQNQINSFCKCKFQTFHGGHVGSRRACSLKPLDPNPHPSEASMSSTSISSKGENSSSSSTISTNPGMLAVGLRKLWISKRGGSGMCDTILRIDSNRFEMTPRFKYCIIFHLFNIGPFEKWKYGQMAICMLYICVLYCIINIYIYLHVLKDWCDTSIKICTYHTTILISNSRPWNLHCLKDFCTFSWLQIPLARQGNDWSHNVPCRVAYFHWTTWRNSHSSPTCSWEVPFLPKSASLWLTGVVGTVSPQRRRGKPPPKKNSFQPQKSTRLKSPPFLGVQKPHQVTQSRQSCWQRCGSNLGGSFCTEGGGCFADLRFTQEIHQWQQTPMKMYSQHVICSKKCTMLPRRRNYKEFQLWMKSKQRPSNMINASNIKLI